MVAFVRSSTGPKGRNTSPWTPGCTSRALVWNHRGVTQALSKSVRSSAATSSAVWVPSLNSASSWRCQSLSLQSARLAVWRSSSAAESLERERGSRAIW